jgi:hypothetical protein
MKTWLLILFGLGWNLAIPAWAQTRDVRVNASGELVAPTNFFPANFTGDGVTVIPTNNGAGWGIILKAAGGGVDGSANSNLSYTIGTEGTNYTLTASNGVRLVAGSDATNHAEAILQSATNYATSATNGIMPANGTGMLTNNGSGVMGWMAIPAAGSGGGWSGSYAVASNVVFVTGNTNHTNVVVEQSIGQFVPMWAVRGSNGTLLRYVDSAGYYIGTNLPKPNFNIPTNNMAFGTAKYARIQPAWTDPESNSYPVAAFSHRYYEIGPLTSTRLSSWGTSPMTNVGCTVSHPGSTEFLPDMFQLATGAGSNASASVATERAIAFSGTRNGANGWFFAGEWTSTNGRVHFGGGGVGAFVGLTDAAATVQTNMSTTTNLASTHYAGFALHGQLGAGATNWHFVTKDNAGGNETRLDTTLPLLASNVYRGWIHCPPQGRTLAVRLDNLTANTTTSFFATATVPTNALRMVATISNRTNIIHSLRVSRLYLEAPTR